MTKVLRLEDLLSTLGYCRRCLPPGINPVHFERLKYIELVLKSEPDHDNE